jgi:hypothetical protein
LHRVLDLDPKRAHVVDRFTEVAWRQHAATATLPAANREADISERHTVA